MIRFKKILLLIVQGMLIGIGSFAVLWLLYFSLVLDYEPTPQVSIPWAKFPLSIFNFVIPVATLAMLTKNWFPQDKSGLYGIAEGLVIFLLYSLVIFLINLIDLSIGWLVTNEWGYGHFTWVPPMSGYTVISILIIPGIVLGVRILIERPLFNQLED